MILYDTLLKRINNETNIDKYIDVRFIGFYINKKELKNVFPKYMLNRNYDIIFNNKKYRYEIWKKKI